MPPSSGHSVAGGGAGTMLRTTLLLLPVLLDGVVGEIATFSLPSPWSYTCDRLGRRPTPHSNATILGYSRTTNCGTNC